MKAELRSLSIFLACSCVALAQVMTNPTIQAMINGGVPVTTIVRTIKASQRIDLYINKDEYAKLIAAGASSAAADQIMTAIHDREYSGVEQYAPPVNITPQPAAPIPVAISSPVPDPAPSPSPPPAISYVGPPVIHWISLEDGTPVRLRISRTLSSADEDQQDTPVDFEVVEDVRIGDQIVIARDSRARGSVISSLQKGRLGRGGQITVSIERVRLTDGESVALRGTKNANGHDRLGVMTAGMVITSLVVWPAVPFFLFMHGKDIKIPKGTEITAYTRGTISLDSGRFSKSSASQ